MRYFVTAERPPTESMGPIGRCIYCGNGPDRQLTDEHVLADGLGGWLTLPEACCDDCRKKIKPFETTAINNNFGLVKKAHGIRAGKRPGRQQRLRERARCSKDTPTPLASEVPHAAIFQHFGQSKRATILTGENPASRRPDFSISRWDTVLPLLNGQNFTFPAVQVIAFFRFLAKTAHCAAFLASPNGGFKPYLRDLILEGNDLTTAARYIGTTDERVDLNEALLHVVDLDLVETDAYPLPLLASVRKKLVIAKMNFFVNHCQGPTYEVVVGEYDNKEFRVLPRDPYAGNRWDRKRLLKLG